MPMYKVSEYRFSPEIIFYGICLIHILVWTLVPALLNQNLPLDVIEELAWGKEWQLGYDKHPPMSAWMMEVFAWLTNRNDWGQYLLSQLSIVTAFWAVWKLSLDFISKESAVISIIFLEGIYFHNFTTPEFNANVALLVFWSLTLLYFWRAVNSNNMMHWVLCGLFAACAVLSKYFAVFLLIPLLLFLFFEKSKRGLFLQKNLYIGILTFIVALMPHLFWIWSNDFITILYGLRRTENVSDLSWLSHVKNPIKFLASILAVLTPLFAMLYALGPPKWKIAGSNSSKVRFLLFVVITPVVMVMLLSAITGMRLRSMWAYPLFIMAGPVIAYLFLPEKNEWKINRFVTVSVVITILFPLIYSLIQIYSPGFKSKGKRTHYPGKVISQVITDKWNLRYSQPLPYVGGDVWIAGNVAWYSVNRPSVYINNSKKSAPWVTDEDLRNNGGIILWDMGLEGSQKNPITIEKIDMYRERFGGFEEQTPIAINWAVDYKLPKIVIGWAIVPPIN